MFESPNAIQGFGRAMVIAKNEENRLSPASPLSFLFFTKTIIYSNRFKNLIVDYSLGKGLNVDLMQTMENNPWLFFLSMMSAK